jgi:hypothetical protein
VDLQLESAEPLLILYQVTPERNLEALAPEERLNVYQRLGLQMVLGPDGCIEVSGTLTDDLSTCTLRAP